MTLAENLHPGVAYVFPGQGSQVVGMGMDLYYNSPAARQVLQETEEALQVPLRQLLFEGPSEELNKTSIAQPALLAVSLACLAAYREEAGSNGGVKPAFVAGHSLGEYTALVAAGALRPFDAVRLVKARGRLMQTAAEIRPGGMAAILGLDEETVESICRETGTQISTVNSEDQIVISGERLALARALDLATARGAKRIMTLQVSGAFHSELMEPAREGMAIAIEESEIRTPETPIVANTTGLPLTSPQAIKQELIDQLCQPVQWHRSVKFITGSGVSTFLEFGPGRVLTGLVKRTCREAKVYNISDIKSMREAVAAIP